MVGHQKRRVYLAQANSGWMNWTESSLDHYVENLFGCRHEKTEAPKSVKVRVDGLEGPAQEC